MPYDARVLTILIASPGDVVRERDAVEEELRDWEGQHRLSASRFRLEVRRWERDGVAELSPDDAQAVINRQLVQDADIVIGLFHTRLGTPTPRAASGTAEELRMAARSGKSVHVYFSMKKVPFDHDPRQLEALTKFRAELEAEGGLIDSFTKTRDLKKKIARAITHDVDGLTARSTRRLAAPSHDLDSGIDTSTMDLLRFPNPTGVHLRVDFDLKGSHHTEYTKRVWIENIGDAVAEDVKVMIRTHGRTKVVENALLAARVGQDVRPGRKELFKLSAAPEPPAELIVCWQERQGEQKKIFDVSRVNPMAI